MGGFLLTNNLVPWQFCKIFQNLDFLVIIATLNIILLNIELDLWHGPSMKNMVKDI